MKMLTFTKLPIKTIPIDGKKGIVGAERFLRSVIRAVRGIVEVERFPRCLFAAMLGNHRGRMIPENEDKGIVAAAES